MAFPEIRAVGTSNSSTNTVSPGLPAGTLPGDLLIGIFESGGETALAEANTALTIAGWTVAGSEKKGNTRITVATKRATGTNDRKTSNDTGDHQIGKILGLKAGTYNEENPINASAFGTQAATKAVKIPGFTTTVAECLVIGFATGNLPDAPSETEFGAATNASLASITERVDNTTNEGDGGAIYAVTGTKATAGAVSETTLTAVTEAERGVGCIAIAPYSDPGSPKFIAKTQTAESLEQTSPLETAKPTGETTDLLLVTVMLALNKKISIEGATEVGEQKAFSTGRAASFVIERGAAANIKITWEGAEKSKVAVCMATYRNAASAATAVDVASNWEEKASSQTPVAPTVTTKGTNRRVVALTTNLNFSEPDDSPENMTMRASFTPAIADVHQAAEGASGTKTFHLATARVTGVQTLALKGSGPTAYEASVSETLSTSDANVRSFTGTRKPSESLTTSDSPARATTVVRAIPEALSLSDAVTRATTVTRKPAESLSTSDEPTRSDAFKRAITETLRPTPYSGSFDVDTEEWFAVGGGTTLERRIVGGEFFTAPAGLRVVTSGVIGEGAEKTVTGVTGGQAYVIRFFLKGPGARNYKFLWFDNGTGSGEFTFTQAEASFLERRFPVNLSSTATSITFGVLMTETGSTLTEKTFWIDSVTVSQTDLVSRTVSVARAIAETLSLSDAVTRVFTGTRKPTETLSTSDAPVSSGATKLRNVAESLSTSESVTRAIATTRAITESLTTSESPSRATAVVRAITQTLSTSDVVTRALVYARKPGETLATSEAPTTIRAYLRSIAESVPTSEVVKRVFSGSRKPSETLSTSDSPQCSGSTTRQVTDSLSTSETPKRQTNVFRKPSESIPTSDAAEGRRSFFKTVIESLTTTDTPTRSSGVFRVITDLTTVVDAPMRVGNFFRKIFDTVTGTDSPHVKVSTVYHGDQTVLLSLDESILEAVAKEEIQITAVEQGSTAYEFAKDEIELNLEASTPILLSAPRPEMSIIEYSYPKELYSQYDDRIVDDWETEA